MAHTRSTSQRIVYGSDLGSDAALSRPRLVGDRIRRTTHWESRNPNNGWERFKAAIRRGWERTSDTVERAIPGDSDRDGR